MAKDKNFKILRNAEDPSVTKVSNVKIGDVFERQGSIHMRVKPCQFQESADKTTICNLNTGSVWEVSDDETVKVIRNCQLSYEVDA